MLFIITAIIIIVSLPLLVGVLISAPTYKGPVSDHFNGKTFINPENKKARPFKDVFKWMRSRKRGPWPKTSNFSFGEKPLDRVVDGIRITFVNHSTFLIQTAGLNILTDPVWSQRVSPFEWAGPSRKRPPGLRLEDVPTIDIILLSHNHWDHLDISTVKKLSERDHPKIITPLGVGQYLETEGVDSQKDLDWWDEIEIARNIRIQAVPAQHFSGRGLLDRDKTLWVGYVIKKDNGEHIYFAGDTGYNTTTFKEIGKRCSPISVSIIPIGAYQPKWFMSPIHCSPDEAVQIHRDVKSAVSVPCHFGTFQLADDGKEEPVSDLKKALMNAGESPNAFVILKEGVSQNF